METAGVCSEQLNEAICVYGKAETIKTCWQLWAKLRASCSVIYVKSWRTISSSWFFKEAQPVTCFWQFSVFALQQRGIWVQWVLRCAAGARELAHENKCTCCHKEKMETIAVFSNFSCDLISLTDKHVHSTSILLLSVFLHHKYEEPTPVFAMECIGKFGDT